MSGNPLLYSFLAVLALLVFALILFAIVEPAAAEWLCCGCIWKLCLDLTGDDEPEPDIYPRMARFDWPRRPVPTTAPVPSFFRWPGRRNRPRMISLPLPDTPSPPPSPIEVPDWPPPCFPRPPPYRMERDSVVDLPVYTKDPGPNETYVDELDPFAPDNTIDSRSSTPEIIRTAMVEEFSVASSPQSSRAASPSPAGESNRAPTPSQTVDPTSAPSPSDMAESNRAPSPSHIVDSNRLIASGNTVESNTPPTPVCSRCLMIVEQES